VPETSQLAVRRGHAYLKVGLRSAGKRLLIDCCALRPCRGVRRGIVDERVSVGCWSRLGADEQLSEIIGVRDAFSHVTRVPELF
jgi:hypothetical protein